MNFKAMALNPKLSRPRLAMMVVAGLTAMSLHVPAALWAAPAPTTVPAVSPIAAPPTTAPITIVATTAPVATTMAVETTDDLRYPAWKNFKINSNATLAGDVVEQGVPVHVSMTQVLTEVNADNVKIETKSAVTFMGASHDAAPQTDTITARTDTQHITDAGTRDIQANGRTYSCKVLDFASDKFPGVKRTVFMSDAVPGGVVEMDVTDATGKTLSLKLINADVK